MSGLNRGEALVIFLTVGFVLFVLNIIAAVVYQCVKFQRSRIREQKM